MFVLLPTATGDILLRWADIRTIQDIPDEDGSLLWRDGTNSLSEELTCNAAEAFVRIREARDDLSNPKF